MVLMLEQLHKNLRLKTKNIYKQMGSTQTNKAEICTNNMINATSTNFTDNNKIKYIFVLFDTFDRNIGFMQLINQIIL